MSLTNETIKNKLAEKFGGQVSNFDEPYGLLTFEADKDINLKIMQFLFDDPELRFQFFNRPVRSALSESAGTRIGNCIPFAQPGG